MPRVTAREEAELPLCKRGTRAARFGILLAVRVFFLWYEGKLLPTPGMSGVFSFRRPDLSREPAGTPVRSRRGAAYFPVAASYCATTGAGIRPRSLTSKPFSLAQLRISLFLASSPLRFRGRPAGALTLRAA